MTRRLVFVTQRVDPEHPALAATIPQIRALAARVDEVVVLAQGAAPAGLPANVEVRAFGAATRAVRGARFVAEVARALRPRPVAVVCHMIPLYAVLAAPLVRPLRIPLVLWYTHWQAHAVLRAAERAATAVVTVDRRSFPLESTKVRPIGHGIDVDEFPCTRPRDREGLQLLVLGRYSPAKGIETILRGVELARRDGLDVSVELHGAALSPAEAAHRRELEELGFPLGDAVPRRELPELFARADALVNNMEAGAPDKVVYEAAAACLPVLASNPVFDELLDGHDLVFPRDDPAGLAARLRTLAAMSAAERELLGRTLRERVAARHSVETWADGILAAAA